MQLSRILLGVGLLGTAAGVGGLESRPNIVFILTDDQDTHMNSVEHMPLLQKYLVNEGTTFERHYCTGANFLGYQDGVGADQLSVAICCPSRVNLWTGQMAHNTNVTDVVPPYGEFLSFKLKESLY